MAANERRKLFQVMKYSNIDNNVRQIWFSGVHSDIGGGYPDDSTLSDIALDWMIQNATKEDLLFAPRQSNNLTALSLDFDNLHIHDEAPLSTPPNRRYEGELLHESLQARINKQNGIYKPDLIGFQLQNMIKPSIS